MYGLWQNRQPSKFRSEGCRVDQEMPFSMIAFTVSRSRRAAASTTPFTNFDAFADPATLWIRSRSLRSSRKANTTSSSFGVAFGSGTSWGVNAQAGEIGVLYKLDT